MSKEIENNKIAWVMFGFMFVVAVITVFLTTKQQRTYIICNTNQCDTVNEYSIEVKEFNINNSTFTDTICTYEKDGTTVILFDNYNIEEL